MVVEVAALRVLLVLSSLLDEGELRGDDQELDVPLRRLSLPDTSLQLALPPRRITGHYL